MTLDELVVRVRVAVDGADGELEAALSDLRRFAQEAAAAAGDASAPQKALWAGLGEAAREAFSKVAEAMRAGLAAAAAVPEGEEALALREAWGALLGPEGMLAGDLTALGEAAQTALPQASEGLTALMETLQGVAEGAQGLSEALLGPAEALAPLSEAQAGAAAGAGEYADAAADMAAQLRGLESQARSLTGIQKHIDAYRDAKRAYDDARRSGRNVEKEFDDMSGAAKKLGVNVDKGSGSLEDMDDAAAAADKRVDALGAGVRSEGAGIVSTLQGMLSQALRTEQALMIQAAMGVDVSQPLSAIQAVIALINTLLSLMGQAGISASGGGSRVDDEAEAARRAAEEAERRRKEAIEADYRAIEHRRHMNEITFEEELAQLEALRQKHQLNAEEIMDWEEKVYDLQQEIRERDAESLDQLSDSVIDALENRYQAMLDVELDRLEASREAWQTWRDDSVRAVEDQIAALDQLAAAQDREKQDAEELRKIEKLRQQIAYEQDDYNRARLQQQLDQALESREERLARLALEDQKEALRAQIEEIEQAADSQLSALDREQEAVEAAYEERMREAALRAEAEKLILGQSQDELLSLLEQYAPDYDALGQTLGEKLLDGFARGAGDVAAWFEDFHARLAQAQAGMAALAQSAADTFYQEREAAQTQAAAPVTVNQTVEFNQPVETPSQVARRMEEVNEALARML